MTGTFITFEGGEGTGKSTQVRLLAERLEARGHHVTRTREPGGAVGAEQIRALLVNGEPARWSAQTEALLNYAARSNHLEATIRPALERGDYVLCDRFMDSTRAYQGVVGNCEAGLIQALETYVVASTRPRLTVLLDLDPEIGLGRAADRGQQAPEDRFERMGLAFHLNLRRAFLDIAAAEPERFLVIHADAPPDEVAERIWALVASKLTL